MGQSIFDICNKRKLDWIVAAFVQRRGGCATIKKKLHSRGGESAVV